MVEKKVSLLKEHEEIEKEKSEIMLSLSKNYNYLENNISSEDNSPNISRAKNGRCRDSKLICLSTINSDVEKVAAE